MKQQLLLSIAIPTWNRANSLNKALSYLLPQIVSYSNMIEVIIPDNASTDNTKGVISSYVKKYSSINFQIYCQKENTGAFCNAKKCRELSNGKFLWILSDDDYILNGVVAKVINYLKNNDDIGGIFLNAWSKKKELCFSNKIEIEKLFNDYANRLTLISAVIFYNEKSDDEYIYNKFDSSLFIGFLFLINVYSFRDKMVVLNGKSFIGANEIAREMNWFKVFVIDLTNAYNFMSEKHFSYRVIKKLKNAVLRRQILAEYINFKMFNKKRGTLKYWKLSKINRVLLKYYYNSLSFWWFMFPFMLLPKGLFKVLLKIMLKLEVDLERIQRVNARTDDKREYVINNFHIDMTHSKIRELYKRISGKEN